MFQFMQRSLCVLIVFAAAAALYGQVERASILGNALDKSGAAIPNANITITNESTNTVVHAVSDNAGAYTVVNLIPGRYSVAASATGFKPFVYHGFELA